MSFSDVSCARDAYLSNTAAYQLAKLKLIDVGHLSPRLMVILFMQ